ncbi:MAG TPA: 3-carboxy-cis,cis-muconate cycloisomerase [Beijerinckiaceae bacterium]|nr:3-carboxy-cis,cis-muconate cycloisomerase [Beijerinckiaceae bacterium]
MTGSGSLYGELFEDHEMLTLFSDHATLQGLLDFEAALSSAQAAEVIIPHNALAPILAACRAELYDTAGIGREATLAGNPAIPMVKRLTEEVARRDLEAARWVHWGATSQDAIDSGRAAQVRSALELLVGRALRLTRALAARTQADRDTVMAGRTLLQHALPMTFGLKTAYWLDALIGHVEALRAVVPTSPVPLGGAAGTLASLAGKGAALQQRLTGAAAPVPFHTGRQSFVRIGCELGMLTGTLGKIARDIMLLMQTEVGEAFEPAASGKGGSSTLPHKRNPVQSLAISAIALRTPGLVSTLLSAMVQEHERAAGGWHAEWEVLPELCILAGAALSHAIPLIEGLEIDAARMRSNLDLTQGLVLSERVALALGERIGRAEAKAVLAEASRSALARGLHLRAVLAEDPRVAGQIDPASLDAMFDPSTYLGATHAIIDRVLARCREL